MTQHSDTTVIANERETEQRSVTGKLPDVTWTLLPPHADDPVDEFIYFLYSAGRIKIGYSRGMLGRYKSLRGAGPFEPFLILVMHGRFEDEQALHVRFHDTRLHGEWFGFSEGLRAYLRRRLCDIGRASLDRAEIEFRNYCGEFLANYRPPPKRSKREHCGHGMPIGAICYPCERNRDLKILEELRRKIDV